MIPSERLGACPAMFGFFDFISTHDPPLEGSNFTWSNNRESDSMSRILIDSSFRLIERGALQIFSRNSLVESYLITRLLC